MILIKNGKIYIMQAYFYEQRENLYATFLLLLNNILAIS